MVELVFIHGAGDSGDVWERQIAHFGDRYATLAVDLPGHGARLPGVGEELDSVERIAADVTQQIHAHGFGAPVLIGHSMGGATAQMIALTEPTLPRALVLAGSGARLRIQPTLVEQARVRADEAPPGVIWPRVIPLDEVTSASAPAEAREWVRQHFGRSTARATYADFQATTRFDVMGRLGEIRQPTLVIGGEDDRWTPPKFQTYFAEHIPNARLVMIPNAGHYPFVEQAATFNRELERFLEEIDGE